MKAILAVNLDVAMIRAITDIAKTEGNPTSAVARRLLTAALDKEVPEWRKAAST